MGLFSIRSFHASIAALGLTAALGAQGQPGLPPVPVPPGNPITAAKADLGQALFWDEQLSSSRAVACGTCHVPSAGGSDPRSIVGDPASTHPGPDGLFGGPDDVTGSPGVIQTGADLEYVTSAEFGLRAQVTGRKSPSMINAAYAPLLFWDGRATSQFEDPETGAVDLFAGAALESQAAGPVLNEVEMGHTGQMWSDVATRLADAEPLAMSPQVPAALAAWIADRSYPELFAEAFGTPEITAARVARAIATYERTLISDQAPVTLAGPGGIGLSPQEQLGQQVFGAANCTNCHTGPLFTNDQFEYIGVRPIDEDLGRGGVTGDPGDFGRMKVPGLLNVELRAPYFHNGSAATLEEVVEFYDRGGDFNGPTKSPLVQPLGLSQAEKDGLVAFLRAMTDPRVLAETGPFERPLLFTEGGEAPAGFGDGSPGTGGHVPGLFSVEPPKLGSPDWTLAVEGGLGGAAVLLGWDLAPAAAGAELLGAPLHLALSPSFQAVPLVLAGLGAGEGYRSLGTGLPGSPTMAGVEVYAQAVVLDAGAAGGLAATPGLRITLF